ncbi:hypothetical protein OIU85_009547 [Salix viminalis]|uniref:Leucine zipper homeobox-associated domain-containing protein n=1 Tax=Salix viminalis TaxID=40686 RepID=A0A9Q0NUN6_SALVM|nr:hypothetical protein OIU85_009547 [Salix viminalis]
MFLNCFLQVHTLLFQVVERQTWADDSSREDQEALLETNLHGDPCQCCKKEMSGLEDEVAHKDKEIHYLNKLLSSKDEEIRRLKDMKTPQQYPQGSPRFAEQDVLGARSSF